MSNSRSYRHLVVVAGVVVLALAGMAITGGQTDAAPQVAPVVINELVAEFHTQGDDKDDGDGISEAYIHNGKIIGENHAWGKDLTFRNDSLDLGQRFDVSKNKILISQVSSLSYRYIMENDDGWEVVFRIKAVCSDGNTYLLSDDKRRIASGNPRQGTIQLRLRR